MNPIPWLSPKMNVSCSNPGASQKNSSAENRPSSIHEATLTRRKSRPGTGFGSALRPGRPCPSAR
jgi:hypothetical protein